jgi:hypothetical protein
MLEITCAEAVPLTARQSPHVSARALRENATGRIECISLKNDTVSVSTKDDSLIDIDEFC